MTHNGNAANYTANALNQYTQRTVTGVFDVAGAAASGATVTVNSSSSGVTRHGEYFFKGHAMSNNPNPVFSTLAVSDGTTTANVPAFTAGTPEAFTYDDDGNLLTDGRWSRTYDAENRLIAMETIAAAYGAGATRQKLEFTLDAFGRRIGKKVYHYSSGWVLDTESRYVYDDWNMIAEYSVSGATISLLRTYAWGLDWSGSRQGAGGVGGLLVTKEGSDRYAPMFDGNGNVMGQLKLSDGSMASAFEYDAFGQTLRESGSYAASNPWRFSTKYTDIETGEVNYGLRVYLPGLGRFANRDPIAERGGLNLYAFVGNNGVNRWDYLGLRCWIKEISGGAYTEQIVIECDETPVNDKPDPLPPIQVVSQIAPDPEIYLRGLPPPPPSDFNFDFTVGSSGGAASSSGSGAPSNPTDGKEAPNNPENPDCAGLRSRLAQAREIQGRNAAKILPGGIYSGGVSLSTNDAISLGAGIVGGIASFTDMALRDRAPLSGPLGTEIWRGNGTANFARTVSHVAVGVSIAADGYAFVTANNNVDRAMAGANLATTGGVLGLPSAGLALLGPSVTWIGPAGLGLAAAQVGINAYVGYRLTSDQRETLRANAQQAWDTANRALETAAGLEAKMGELGCK